MSQSPFSKNQSNFLPSRSEVPAHLGWRLVVGVVRFPLARQKDSSILLLDHVKAVVVEELESAGILKMLLLYRQAVLVRIGGKARGPRDLGGCPRPQEDEDRRRATSRMRTVATRHSLPRPSPAADSL
jgi:hypothetical protein